MKSNNQSQNNNFNTTVQIPNYQITETVYSGSRTIVYRAIRMDDRKPVVIKLLKKEYPTFSELVQFRNQYTIAKNLNFPLIIKTYSLETYQNGYVLVMEDFGGISLKEWINQKKNELSLEEFLEVAISLCNALEILYRERIIHKDIKPSNILINPTSKQVKLIDFSIASLLPRETPEIENPNILEGTLAYISPEQTGRMNRGIDYRTDFYSLGVTFYELLTGELPFQSDDAMELVHCHIAKTAPLVREIKPKIPAVLSKTIAKLMAKNTEDRYQSALGLKLDLETCLKQLTETGKIEDFEIGQRDLSDRFLIPEKLYGRETEVETLLQAFERVSEGATEMMLVAGFSGIGKTAVVNEVHKPIVRQRGYFVKGKFDQFNRNIPFSAFVIAFRDLMGQLLTESDAQIQRWKDKILEAIGENGQVIIEVIPELEKIIGQQPPAVELSGTAAQNRFNLLFQKFTQVFTSKEHPLVIFLDDLQWADSASLNLIQVLMANTHHLLLIGAYRDNEVNPAHPLMLTLNELKQSLFTVRTITLAPLSQETVDRLVADTLKCSLTLALPLSQLVFQKTKGNPFFATQFLKALHEENFVEFNFDLGCWQCDIAKVKQQALTEDVVEFMALQLNKLPLATQEILKLAACIGNQFDIATLAIVSEKSEIETGAALWRALQEGLILPKSEVYKFYVGQDSFAVTSKESQTVSYKFLHDRVQQAAYSLIPEAERAIAHYQIGQLLLQQISPSAREERIFELVNQLNYGTTLLEKQQEKDELARLNLTACRKARAATAYQAAREYATVGLELLGADAWERHYQITLSLHDLAAEVAFLVGDFEQMNQRIEAVIHHAKTPLEQVPVYQVKIQALVAHNQFLEAIEIGQSVFKMLGVNLPDEPTLDDIRPIKEEIDVLIGERSIESLLHLPKMTDPLQLAIIQNAARLVPVSYMLGTTFHFLMAALEVKLSIQFGNSPVSAYSYVGYGFQLRVLWADMSKVPQFGQLGYQLSLEPYSKNIRPATALVMGGYVGCWTIHLKETLPILLDGYQSGLETGNLEFMGYNAQLYCFNAYWYGQPLPKLEPQIRTYYQQLCDFNQFTPANSVLAYWQAAQILLGEPEGESENQIPLRLDAYEEKVLEEAKVDFYRLSFFYLYRFTLNYWLEDFAQAERDGAQTRQYLAGGMGSILEPLLYLYDSLTVLATPGESMKDSEPRWQRMEENQAKLKEWADYGPMNYLHKYHLVEAEKHRVLGRKTEALDFYDLAIQGAKENGFIQEEGLANELAAKFYLQWGKEKVAAGYIQEAYYCYAHWGAVAKVADLEKRYPQLLAPILQQTRFPLSTRETIFSLESVTSTNSPTSNSSVSVALDLAAILKVSQTISSEIELEKLLSSLLSIVIENAGADQCALVLSQDDRLLIQGSMTLGKEPVVLQGLSVEGSQEIPRKLIYKVKNNLQIEVAIDASAEPSLAGDPYIERYRPKSVLCSPILHQGKLLGILYLENNSTKGAFTRDRVKLLNVLCAQAAISLENALLYERSQQYSQKLERALLDLQNAQVQLVQSEKMSALGNLVSGIGHEMNNPLGFISATLEQAKPAVMDVFDHLKLYQKTFPNKTDEIVERAEEIDLDYTLEDLPEMLDSMKMACDRLKHISTSLRIFSRADKEHKVPFNLHDGIDSTILILKHRLKGNEKRPEIEVVKNYGSLPEVNCYPGQLNQVFMNLLANAIDALEEFDKGKTMEEIKSQPDRITITTEVDDKKQNAIVRIKDNGPGISEEVKQKIFDHLFTTKQAGKGTGLGLSISRQIVVEKHGGKITCSSEVGEGTEFAIALPLRD